MRGIISATIATVLDLGWWPIHPNKWLDEGKKIFADLSAEVRNGYSAEKFSNNGSKTSTGARPHSAIVAQGPSMASPTLTTSSPSPRT